MYVLIVVSTAISLMVNPDVNRHEMIERLINDAIFYFFFVIALFAVAAFFDKLLNR